MKAKVLYASGFAFVGDNGKPVIGYRLHICGVDAFTVDDGQGNFKLGYPTEVVKVSGFDADRLGMVASDFAELQGKDVEISYEKAVGSKYDRIASIKIVE